MRLLYLISVGVHVLAATLWIGGLFFIVLVVVPWLKKGAEGGVDPAAFLRETGERFRLVGWVCFGILALTGSFNLWVRGVRPVDLADLEWWTAPFGSAVALKLVVFALVVGVSAVHDFVIGPRATEAIQRDPGSAETVALRRRASLLGRLNGLLALVLLGLGVVLVRGWP